MALCTVTSNPPAVCRKVSLPRGSVGRFFFNSSTMSGWRNESIEPSISYYDAGASFWRPPRPAGVTSPACGQEEASRTEVKGVFDECAYCTLMSNSWNEAQRSRGHNADVKNPTASGLISLILSFHIISFYLHQWFIILFLFSSVCSYVLGYLDMFMLLKAEWPFTN